MTTSTSLIDMILNLLRNPSELAAFQQDPQSYLAACGADQVSPADIRDALVLAQDDQDGQDGGAGRDHAGAAPGVHLPPPPPAPHPQPGETEHEAAIRYLNTYVNNTYVDDRDTTVDNSVNQQIDTGGGDFDQDIDVRSTTASGDGAVAAGGDIEGSTVTTGNGNQVGDGNVSGEGNVVGDGNQAVTGDGNTTSFGAGDTTTTSVGGDVTIGSGGAFGSGGDVSVDNSDNSVTDSFNDRSDNSVTDSFNDQSDNSVHDSGNAGVDASVHDSGNDNSQTSTEDSFNDQSDNSTQIDNSQHDVGNLTL